MLTITLYPSQPHAGAGLVEAAEKIPLKTGGWVKMLTICNY